MVSIIFEFQVIEEENLQQNCKINGKYFIEQLMELQKVYPVIGDVRGKGLMLGIELVEPGTKDPLSKPEFGEIMEMIKDSGVLIGAGGRWGNVRLRLLVNNFATCKNTTTNLVNVVN